MPRRTLIPTVIAALIATGIGIFLGIGVIDWFPARALTLLLSDPVAMVSPAAPMIISVPSIPTIVSPWPPTMVSDPPAVAPISPFRRPNRRCNTNRRQR